MKAHRNQLILPEELRRTLHIADEDYVDAEVVEDGCWTRSVGPPAARG